MDRRLKHYISLIDLTSLNDDDTDNSIIQLIEKANLGYKGTFVAALCVFPKFGKLVKEQLSPQIRTAVVGPAFPGGKMAIYLRKKALAEIAGSKVDEVDIVADPFLAINGMWDQYDEQIKFSRNLLPGKTLKVILETGELNNTDTIQKAAETAIAAGADFLKTSTGKTTTGYTPKALEIFCRVVQEHFAKTGKCIGIKTSGGIRTLEQVEEIFQLTTNILGSDWLKPATFRIGASSLYDNLLAELG